MKKQVLVRGVEEDAYKRAKATAALLGVSMGTAVGEALTAWADRAERTALEQELGRDLAFVRNHWDELGEHRGKVVVVASGKLQGVFQTHGEAKVFSSRFRVALAFPVDGTPARHEVEFGPELALQ